MDEGTSQPHDDDRDIASASDDEEPLPIMHMKLEDDFQGIFCSSRFPTMTLNSNPWALTVLDGLDDNGSDIYEELRLDLISDPEFLSCQSPKDVPPQHLVLSDSEDLSNILSEFTVPDQETQEEESIEPDSDSKRRPKKIRKETDDHEHQKEEKKELHSSSSDDETSGKRKTKLLSDLYRKTEGSKVVW